MAFPKLYNDVAPHNAKVRSLYANDLKRPLLIVGNGPSSAVPIAELLPDNPVVFRMNWFFLETRKYYGSKVDGYFWSIETLPLQDELAHTIAQREYDFRAFFAPMRPEVEVGKHNVLDERFQPIFDHWALVAENPTLARELMGRPLPTQGFQVLAFALATGFRDIYLTGIDLYESDEIRYPYKIPDHVASQLPEKDLQAGYENDHRLDRDLSFFETCRAQYPDARFRAVSDSGFLREHVGLAEHGSSATVQVPERIAAYEPNTLLLPNGRRVHADALESTCAPEEYAKVIDGNKCAYVTMFTGRGWRHGLVALANSLKAVTDVPLVAMCLPETEREGLELDNVVFYDIEPIDNPNELEKNNARFAQTYSKLRIWSLDSWDRLVFLDADAIVLQNIDSLFQLNEFAAAPDLGIELRYDRFNTGVFCCQPSQPLFERILAALGEIESYDGGDQGFLNQFFPQPRMLDRTYNTLKRVYVHHPNLFRWEDVKVLHFVGPKPWEKTAGTDPRYIELERKWWSFLSGAEAFAVIRDSGIDAARSAALASRAVPATATDKSNGKAPPELTTFERKFRKLRRDPVQFVRDAKFLRALEERAVPSRYRKR